MVDATQTSRVEATVEVVRGLVAGVDPDGVTPVEAPRQWRAVDAIARHAGAAKVLLARAPTSPTTHLGRRPTTAQRIALLWQTPTCTNQTCARSFVQIDHRQPWAHTHQTQLANLDPLCPHRHHLKTHHNWALAKGTGKRPLVPPTNPRHPRHTKPKRRAA